MAFPEKLSEFIGNKSTVEMLKILTQNKLKKEINLPNILFYGRPGLGKTTLAQLCAKEIDYELQINIGNQLNPETLFDTLFLNESKVFLIDEIHSIDIKTSELLYSALQDKVIYQDNFTYNVDSLWFIGATTNLGLLSKPLIDRFVYQFFLEPYTKNELIQIAGTYLQKIEKKFSKEYLELLSNISQGTPRLLKNIITATVDIATYYNITLLSTQILLSAMKILGINNLGLNKYQQIYIHYLQQQENPIGLSAISAAIGIPILDLENNIEPYLIERGFIIRTSRGRKITEIGKSI